MDFDQSWYIVSPHQELKPYWLLRSLIKIKVTEVIFLTWQVDATLRFGAVIV